MFEGFKELFESKEKKAERLKTQQFNEKMKQDIEDGKSRVVEHDGKKYACTFSQRQETEGILITGIPKDKYYADVFRVYPQQENGQFSSEGNITVEMNMMAFGGKPGQIGYREGFSLNQPCEEKNGEVFFNNNMREPYNDLTLYMDVKRSKESKPQELKYVKRENFSTEQDQSKLVAEALMSFSIKQGSELNDIINVIGKAYPETVVGKACKQYDEEFRKQEEQRRKEEENRRRTVEHKGKRFVCSLKSDFGEEKYTIYHQQKNGNFDTSDISKSSTLAIKSFVNAETNYGTLWDLGPRKISKPIPLMAKAHNSAEVDGVDLFDSTYKSILTQLSIDGQSKKFVEIESEISEINNISPEKRLTDLFSQLENNPSRELLEIISKAYPESVLGSTYAKYKEQLKAQQRQSCIAETNQRLSERKNKSQEQSAEQQSEVMQEQQQTNSVVQETSNIETLAKQKAIKDRFQKE